ncbi:MAG: Serine/threonine-protein kinase PknD [Acidimicrobiales bacterium]|nr:MAG: serine/threonine protein kinase [Actinomycetota bacterium]MBV6507887.1 Serine/threonine-protein kinase PknD [Acidimicrobiales bacterium]RIK06031.1 MAG: hypothetical protein DCC48_08760 [Acidobacteriota bacterium]
MDATSAVTSSVAEVPRATWTHGPVDSGWYLGAMVVALALDGFTELVEIGRGGNAIVYRATQTALGRSVALKVLDRQRLDEKGMRQFRREAAALGALSWHPNVVQVYDTRITEGGLPVLVMEYLPGGTFSEIVRVTPLSWQQASRVGVCLGDALNAAHRAGVLHRDVKPGNILVGPRGQPKLADFGVAAVESTFDTTGGQLGMSIAHTAPEVLDGSRTSEASDIYSFGSTLFELLAGRPAFVEYGDESIIQSIKRVADAPVPDLGYREVPPELVTVIERCMAKDPADRPGSMSEVVDALQAARIANGADPVELPAWDHRTAPVSIVEAKGVAPSPSDAEETIVPPQRRVRVRRAVALLSGVCLLVTLAVAAVVTGGDDRRAPSDDEGEVGAQAGAGSSLGAGEWRLDEIQVEHPLHIAGDGKSVWVTSATEGRLVQVDEDLDVVRSTLLDSPGFFELDGETLIERVDPDNAFGALMLWIYENFDDFVFASIDRANHYDHVAVLGEKAYVAVGTDSLVYEVDLQTGALGRSVQVGLFPASIVAWDGLLCVGNALSSSVSVIDPESMQVVAEMDSPAQVLQAGPDGIYAYGSRGDIWRVDLQDGAHLAASQIPDGLRSAMAVGEDAAYVSSGQGRVEDWTDPGSLGAEVGVELETGRGHGLVTRVDLETGELLSVPIGDLTQGVAVNAEGVWVIDRNKGVLHLLDLDTLEKLDTLAVEGQGVYNANGAIWVLDPTRDVITRVARS